MTNKTMTPAEELEALKAQADELGLSYHPSIGLEKLRERIDEFLADDNDDEPQATQTGADKESKKIVEETRAQRRARKRREASELVRIRVTCMNPYKREWEGEIFTAGNTLVGTFTKYVPFNVDDGWHVPRIIYNQIRDRQCQIFVSERDSRGNVIRKGKLIKEFSVEVLPNLTEAELKELARRQAMKNAVDSE